MGKRSTGRKRGILRGLGKHKIKIKPLEGQSGETVFGVKKSVVSDLGAKCFEVMYQGSVFFQLVPFRRTIGGEYIPLIWKQKVPHYAVLCLWFALTLHKLLGTLEILLFEELKVQTFICVTLFLIHLVAIGYSVGVWARPEETMDLLNSWPLILPCIQEIRKDKLPFSPFDDASTALKLILNLAVTQGVAFTAAVMTVMMSNLPVCLFPLGRCPYITYTLEEGGGSSDSDYFL